MCFCENNLTAIFWLLLLCYSSRVLKSSSTCKKPPKNRRRFRHLFPSPFFSRQTVSCVFNPELWVAGGLRVHRVSTFCSQKVWMLMSESSCSQGQARGWSLHVAGCCQTGTRLEHVGLDSSTVPRKEGAIRSCRPLARPTGDFDRSYRVFWHRRQYLGAVDGNVKEQPVKYDNITTEDIQANVCTMIKQTKH